MLILLEAQGVAQTNNSFPPDVQKAFNDFSHEMQTCQVYNLIGGQCFGDQDKTLLAKMRRTADAFGELALNSAKIVGLSEKALLARATILSQEMMEDMDKNCLNISVLLAKYAKQCKAAMENSNARIESIVKGRF
jgi:ABC-type enterochelin transport system ATPase subunit